MPVESRRFAKAALLFFAATFGAGAAFTIARLCGYGVPEILIVEHAHAGFVGFLANIVIGVALWMLPLDRARYPETAGRYPRGAPLWCFVLLNGGLIVRLVAEPMMVLTAPRSLALGVALGAAAVAQFAAALLFAAIAWSRVRAPARVAPGVR